MVTHFGLDADYHLSPTIFIHRIAIWFVVFSDFTVSVSDSILDFEIPNLEFAPDENIEEKRREKEKRT